MFVDGTKMVKLHTHISNFYSPSLLLAQWWFETNGATIFFQGIGINKLDPKF